MSGKYSIPAVLVILAMGILTGCQLFAPGAAATPASDPDPKEAFLPYSQCMRDNGLPNFPEPTDNGLFLPPDIDRESPEFIAADEVCESLLPPPEGAQRRPLDSGQPDPTDAEWEKIVPGGDTACADGSEFAYWVRPADPAKVVFWMDGGGACWDSTTCAFSGGGTYDWNVSSDDEPMIENGIFDLSNPDNPFADNSFVYVPYCTGDVHLGDVTREYTPELTVQHKGFVNGSTALAYLAENYLDANQVVVIGESAGSVAAPVYAGLAADVLPDAQITVIADSSGAYPDDPDTNIDVLGQWGTFETMPDWEVNAGLTAQDWGIPRFWIQAGLHDPAIVMARFDYAFDETQMAYMDRLGLDSSNLVASMDGNEVAIEAAGVIQHSYTAPGTDHGVLGGEGFYMMEVNDVRLVDWVRALIDGEPLPDVHCDACVTE